MSFLPGTSRDDQFGDTRINPHDAAVVARLVTWHAHTDTDHALLLDALGLGDVA